MRDTASSVSDPATNAVSNVESEVSYDSFQKLKFHPELNTIGL